MEKNAIKDGGFILEGLAMTVGGYLGSSLQPVITKIHDRNPKRFATKMKVFAAVLDEMKEFATDTPTKLDDAAIGGFSDAVKLTANKLKVTL